MSATLALPALLGLLTGQSISLGALLPADVIGAARAIDGASAAVAAYAPKVCALTDKPLDALTDALEASRKGRATIGLRILAGLTAASDAVCSRAASEGQSAYGRAKIVIEAASAIDAAEAQLSQLNPQR